MRQISATGLASILLWVLTPALFAQARFSGVGDLPGGNIRSEVYGVSGNGRTVIGSSEAEGTDGFAKFLPFLWGEGGGLSPFGADVISNNKAGYPFAVSHESGLVVGEYKKNVKTSGGPYATMEVDVPFLSAAGGLSPLHPQPDSPWVTHHGMAISGDGSTIVGSFDLPEDSLYALPCTYTGGVRFLPLPAEMNQGVAKGVSFDGSVIVGEARSSTNRSYPYWAFVWKNGGYTELDRSGPGLPIIVNGISADGKTAIGTKAVGSSSSWSAAVWRIEGGGLGGVPSPAASANGISADGEIIVGQTAQISALGRTAAFVWDGARGLQLVEDVLQKQFGVSLAGWRLLKATGVSADGSVIVGTGTNPSGWTEGWFAYIPYVFARGIFANQVFRPGEKDTLTFKCGGVNAVNIYLSLDSGKTRQALVRDFPTLGGRYIWTIPDTISKECRVIIEDANDPRTKHEGPIFTIRGDFLIREDPANAQKWEIFDPVVHGWKFANDDKYLWPIHWWQTFDYVMGTDPYTNARYPLEEPFISKPSWTFPDWPLFVRTFTAGACYWSTPIGLYYREAAKHFWEAHTGEWGGSCFGFAISTLLAFNQAYDFRGAFPEMPGYNGPRLSYRLGEFDTTANIRATINSLMAAQEGAPHWPTYLNRWKTLTPKQALAEVRGFLGSTSGYRRSIGMQPANDKGAHEVMPYRISPDPGGPGRFRLYVNDSRSPGRYDTWILVDTLANTWEYGDIKNKVGASWQGTMHLVPSDPASTYLDRPWLQKSGMESPEQRNFLAMAGTYELFFREGAEVRVSDRAGRVTGFVGDTLLNDIPGAVPKFPLELESPPYGYALPKGEYAIEVSRSTDTAVVFKLFSDSLLYSYRRYGVDSSDTDDLRVGSGGIHVRNRDAAVKSFAVEAVIPLIGSVGERQFAIRNLSLGQGDSLRAVYPFVSDDIIVANYGTRPITYDLDLRYVQRQSSTSWTLQKFVRLAIPMKARSTHKLDPSWSSMQGQSLHIAVDTANTGAYTVDLYLSNQLTDVQEKRPEEEPLEWGLFPNYPNPFNPATTIRFSLPTSSEVRLSVFDLLGREVAVLVEGAQEAGMHEVTFDGSALASGVYYYRLKAGDFVQTRRLVLVK